MAKKAAAKKSAAKKKAPARAKSPARGKAPQLEMLLVGSKAKAALKAYGVNVGGDALVSLNLVVHWYIEQATKRAHANGRKTVRAHDFMAG